MEPLSKYRLRPASAQDCEAILAIRNQKEVRENSFDSSVIDLATHKRWYENSLKDSHRRLLVLEDGQRICGVLRFDIKNSTAEISLYLDPAYFGQGLGKMLLAQGLDWLKSSQPAIKTLHAKILPSNLRSADLFAKNGFESQGEIWVRTL